MKYNRIKRALSGLLAGAMLLSSTSAMVSFAASSDGIKFIAEDAATTTIIEGSTVDATAVLPQFHTFVPTNPFFVRIGSGIGAETGLISIRDNTSNHYTITGNEHSASGAIPSPVVPSNPTAVKQTTYSLEPQLMATLNNGTGTLDVLPGTIPPIPPETIPTPTPGGFYNLSVKSTKTYAITADSSFNFKAERDESSNGTSIQFGSVLTTSGLFRDFLGKQISLESMTTTGGKKVIKVTVGGTDGFELTTSLPAGEIITAGSEFTVNYRLQGINPLILNVVTPQWAANQTAASVQSNPVDPLVPDKFKIPYVRLAAGDTLASITTNFDVLALVARYNSKDNNQLKIKWEWKPDGGADFDNVLLFGADSRQTQSVTLNPRQDDVKGKLIATVEVPIKDYNNGTETIKSVKAQPVEVNVTILGTGIPPKLNPLTKTIGATPEVATDVIPSYMDVYIGNVAGFTSPENPHTFTASMVFGMGRGRAEKTVIRATGITPDAIKIYIDNSPIPYDFGTDILNTDKVAGQKAMSFKAIKRGSVTLHFDYYVKNNKGQLVVADSSEAFTITIQDTTPSDFAQLYSLALQSPALENPVVAQYPGGAISYGFKSDTFLYANIEIPYLADTLNITPTIPDNKYVVKDIAYEITGAGLNATNTTVKGTVETGKPILIGGNPIPMFVESPRTVTLTLTAQNGRKQLYILTINRMPPSRDSSMKNLTVTDTNGVAILKGFSPTQKEYAATVPYSMRWAKFVVEKNDPWSVLTFLPELIEKPEAMLRMGTLFGDKNWLRLLHKNDKNDFYGLSNTTEEKITVQAQDGSLYPNGSPMYATTYTVRITRADPSTNTFATSLDIKDQKNRVISFDNDQKFVKETKNYAAHIPYSSEKLTLSILPEDVLAQSVTVTSPSGVVTKLPYTGDKQPLVFTVDTPVGGNTEAAFAISFTVEAESDASTKPPYVINVVRNDPDQDSSLTSLDVKDQNDVDVKTFTFNPQTTVYSFSVPFDTEQIRVTPKPRSDLATAKVNGETIDAKMPYHITLIKAGETKNIKVEIFPEDKNAEPRVYELTVTRELPSTDARLKELVVAGGEKFTPRFIPNTTTYSVTIPEGTNSITFTATPLGTGSTMTLNGATLLSAVASEPYEPYEARTVVKIEVTAQDGKTKMTYTINVTNQNLLPKSNNADLATLDIREGSMSPRFKAGVTDYEVAVKDDVSSVDILPVPRDEGATMKVLADSKQLGDYYDRYSTAIRDGETTITVEVTAEDGKAKKTYEVIVYRKDEEKQGSYKPVTEDMVDYGTNPIVVDISKYTVISAEVLNKLKQEYPEKTMVFEGNDYSLQITGKDIATLIPHAVTYDLGITFSSPNEDDIWKLIYEHPRNDGIEPVFIHFNHHGALPGRMLFTISLGRTYRTQNSTWNYYNEERERIDYYGGVRTNSRGTFTVPITHMSTYIYSKDRIDGAENKSGELGQVGDLTGSSGVSKPNPNTGTEGCK